MYPYKILFACIPAICIAAAYANGTATTSANAEVRKLSGLTYAQHGGTELKLDLYLPASSTDLPVPLLVWIHGGAWAEGGRGFCPIAPLAKEGYAVASISYRLSATASFPAQIEDCKAAIRWLRAQAAEYSFDPNRIGICGESAGGHLAALLGTAPHMPAWGDVEGAVPSNVHAVAGLCGVFDLNFKDMTPDMVAAMLQSPDPALVAQGKMLEAHIPLLEAALGGPLEERKELAQLMSPLHHVTPDDPPFFLIHGDKDRLVPLSQSEDLYAALLKVGVQADLLVIPGADHGFGRPEPQMMEKIRSFFDQHLAAQ